MLPSYLTNYPRQPLIPPSSPCPCSQTTLFTYIHPSAHSRKHSREQTYLKEPLQPPDLKDSLPNQDPKLENAPPLHPAVCALSCVAMRALADYDIRLLVFDLGEKFCKKFHYQHRIMSAIMSQLPNFFDTIFIYAFLVFIILVKSSQICIV